MLRAASVGGDKGKVNLSLHRTRKFNLPSLCRVPQTLQSHFVIAEINAGFLSEFLKQPFQDCFIKVVAPQVSVTISRLDLKHAVAHGQDGYVKSTAAQIKHGDGRIGLLFVQAIGQRRCCRLVDDT